MHLKRRKVRRACRATVVALALSTRNASAGDNPNLNITDYDIPQLEAAYASGTYTPMDAVNFYLSRIAQYDQSGPDINSVVQLNPNAMAAAQADEALLKSGATTAQYPLLGVPILVKDSYDVAGLVTTNGVGVLRAGGTGSVTNLVAQTNAPNVQELVDAGAIILGKANMSTMAYSYNGISDSYGRTLNPYDSLVTPGGSSSGPGAAVSASFAMFAMGGETGGSIRVPSTSDDDVGLKTSAGLINPAGTWPLTPSRDVVGPIARDVTDIAVAMNVLAQPSATNIWNNTPFYPTGTPQPGTAGTRPTDYTSYLDPNYLEGKVIALPDPYVGMGKYNVTSAGSPANAPYLTYQIDPQILAAFNTAVTELKALGATVVYVNIPAFDIYSNTLGASSSVLTPNANTAVGKNELANLAAINPSLTAFPFAYPATSTGAPSSTWSSNAAAYYYEKQIEGYNNPQLANLDAFYHALANSPGSTTFSAGGLSSAVSSVRTLAQTYDSGQAAGFDPATNPQAIQALQAFASLRQVYYTGFMNNPTNSLFGADALPVSDGITHIDAFAFPTLGYLEPYQSYTGKSNASESLYSAAGLPARFEGNILGVPGIAVPMGFATQTDGQLDPMSLEFMGDFDGEGPIIGMAYAYEQATHLRQDPNLAALPNPTLYSNFLVPAAAVPEPPSMVMGVFASVIVALGSFVRRRIGRSPL